MTAHTSLPQPATRDPGTTVRALLDAIPDLVLRVCADGSILTASTAATFAQTLGYESHIDRLQDFLPQALVDDLLEAIGRTLVTYQNSSKTYSIDTPAGPQSYELRLVALDGNEVALIVRPSGAPNLKQRQLSEQVEAQAESLRTTNASLARAARMKDEFLASVSHELRTPLNAILGLSEALQEEVYGAISQAQAQALHSIEESGRHLLALINDILELSKIEAGKLELQIDRVAVGQVCQASIRLIEQSARKKRLNIVTNFDDQVTVVRADERRLKQMLVNLLSNAVKFTPERGSIGIDVVAMPEKELVQFTVWDTGIGIDPEHVPHLFQPFVQLDSSLARQYAGTGLGLALVFRMIQLHGGTVEVVSRPNEGSRFSLVLPWKSSDNYTIEATSSRLKHQGLLKRILVIDSSPQSSEQLARYLRELGVDSIQHLRGDNAAQKAIELRPDAIILDIQLAGKQGWEVLAELKSAPETTTIPVMILSVVDEPERAQQLGAAAYLIKPISRQQLRTTLPLLMPSNNPKRVVLMSSETSSRLAVFDDGNARSHPNAHSTQSTVLLVEDNELAILTVVDYLQAIGYHVVVARNGQEAINQAVLMRPAVVLMDIHLPGMSGFEAIQRLRAMPATAVVPIIALTALAMPGDRERCLAVGANAYLSKPVSLQNLIRTVEMLCQ